MLQKVSDHIKSLEARLNNSSVPSQSQPSNTAGTNGSEGQQFALVLLDSAQVIISVQCEFE